MFPLHAHRTSRTVALTIVVVRSRLVLFSSAELTRNVDCQTPKAIGISILGFQILHSARMLPLHAHRTSRTVALTIEAICSRIVLFSYAELPRNNDLQTTTSIGTSIVGFPGIHSIRILQVHADYIIPKVALTIEGFRMGSSCS